MLALCRHQHSTTAAPWSRLLVLCHLLHNLLHLPAGVGQARGSRLSRAAQQGATGGQVSGQG